MIVAGRQVLAELLGCDAELLSDVPALRRLLEEAARTAGGTVLGSQFHRFNPIGASGIVLLAESHLSIHTWPEWQYAAVDVFGCGVRMDPEAAVRRIGMDLGADEVRWLTVDRGRDPDAAAPCWQRQPIRRERLSCSESPDATSEGKEGSEQVGREAGSAERSP